MDKLGSWFRVEEVAWTAWREHRSGLLGGICVWSVFYLSPLISGWAMASAIDLMGDGLSSLMFSCIYAGVETLTVGALWWGNVIYEGAQRAAEFDMRTRVCGHAFRARWRHRFGRGMAPGELLVRVTQDSPELVLVIDCWLDFVGVLIYSMASLLVIAMVSVRAMAIAMVCFSLFLLGNLWCSRLIAWAFRLERSGFDAVGERMVLIGRSFTELLFSRKMGSQLIYYGDELEVRTRYALNTSSLTALMTNANAAFGSVCTAIVLVVVAGTSLDAAAIVLLVAYLGKISQLPQKVGNLIAARRRAAIALDRIGDVEGVDGAEESDRDAEFVVSDAVDGAVALVEEIVWGGGEVSASDEVRYVDCDSGTGDGDLVYAVWDALLSMSERGALPKGAVVLVRSNSCVFSGTVRNNLGDVDDELGAFALSSVELDGEHSGRRVWLDRLLAAEGVDLSGGERQRLIIGRAIASCAKVVLVDRGIAGVPSEQEARIFRNCLKAGCVPVVMRSRTV